MAENFSPLRRIVMKKIISVSFVIFLSFVLASGQTAAKEERVIDSLNGFSFVVPVDWTSRKSEGGYVLSDATEKSNIVIKPHNFASYDELIKSQGSFESDGFKQVGEMREFKTGGKFLRLYKQLSDKNLIADTFFVRSDAPYGGVILVSFSTDNETADEMYEVAYKIADGMRFLNPETTIQKSEQSTGESSGIKKLFAGKKLSYFYTGNGYTENASIWLCASSRFFSKNESSSSSALGSGFTQGSDAGTWDIITSGNNIFLVIKSDKGGSWNISVTARQASNEINLNGKRFFVQTQSDCN